jgi:hypothetical protein
MGKLKEKFVSGSAVFKIATKRDINALRVKLYFTHCISFLGIVEHLSVHHLSDIFSDANPKTFSSGPYGMGKIAAIALKLSVSTANQYETGKFVASTVTESEIDKAALLRLRPELKWLLPLSRKRSNAFEKNSA